MADIDQIVQDMINASLTPVKADIDKLKTDVAKNASAITALTTRVAALEAGKPPVIEPPVEPPVEPPPSGFVWPDATTAGVQIATLTPSTQRTFTTAGQVIEGKSFTGTVSLNGANQVLRNCRIQVTGQGQGVNCWGGGAKIENCDIFGGTGAQGSYGIYGVGTFIGNDISGWENGILCGGSNVTVKGNYIHDLKASGAPHYDGIAMHGGDGGQSNIVVEDNNILAYDTSAIFIKTDFGNITNVTVNHNRCTNQPGTQLDGPSAQIYDYSFGGRQATGIKITNNVLQKGAYGTYYNLNGSTATFSGNVDAITGAAI